MKYFTFLSISVAFFTACTTPKTVETAQMQTLSGAFESTKGIMTPLSCYCFNGGFLTTPSEKRIPICFENNEGAINCSNISVTGFYKTIKNKPEPTSPCKAGEMTYFKVISFKCL